MRLKEVYWAVVGGFNRVDLMQSKEEAEAVARRMQVSHDIGERRSRVALVQLIEIEDTDND